MAKSIRDYLPAKPKVDTKLVQAHCQKDLVLQTLEQMRTDGITWQHLLEAAMHRYLEESREKKSDGTSAADQPDESAAKVSDEGKPAKARKTHHK